MASVPQSVHHLKETVCLMKCARKEPVRGFAAAMINAEAIESVSTGCASRDAKATKTVHQAKCAYTTSAKILVPRTRLVVNVLVAK